MAELDLSKKRLKWQCRRGMLELDVLLNRYLETQYDTLALQQRQMLQQVLSLEDPTLYAYLMLETESPVEYQETIHAIKQWFNA